MTFAWIAGVSPIVISACLIAAAIPMAMRKVPLNQFYGFRTWKTMSDTRIWYDANQKAGINMIVACLVTLAIWGVCRVFGGAPVAALVAVPVTVIAQVTGLVVSFVQLSKM